MILSVEVKKEGVFQPVEEEICHLSKIEKRKAEDSSTQGRDSSKAFNLKRARGSCVSQKTRFHQKESIKVIPPTETQQRIV